MTSTDHTVVVAGLAVHELGGDEHGPTLVLFHANGDSGGCWPDAARRWSPEYRVLAVDMRGHGSSPRFLPDQLVEPGDVFVADTIAVLTALRHKGARLGAVGHSLGAAALTGACAAEPGLVDAVVLVDPPWDTPVVSGSRPWLGEQRRAEVLAYQRDPAGALESLRTREPDWPDEERRGWVAAKTDLDLDYVATGGGRPSSPWTELVPRLRAPTLLVTGDRDVLVGPESRAVVDVIGNPAVEVVVIPGAGHYVRHQQTKAFHTLVDPWLTARLRGRAIGPD
jgi:pimeloyl-ACP methyl ester carboxylesterase